MTINLLSVDSAITDSLRRIPGRGAVTIVTWLTPLVPAAGAVLYVTASSPSWAPIAALSALISIIAVGPVWWLLRVPLRRLPRTPESGLLCMLAYANVGLLGGFIVVSVLQIGSPDAVRPDMLSTPSVLLTTVSMTMLLSTLVAIAASWRWDLHTAVAIARSRRHFIGASIIQRDFTDSAERHALATAMNEEIIGPLFVAEELIPPSPTTASDELESLAGSVVRPLSHRFHSDTSTQLAPLALTGYPLPDPEMVDAPLRHTLRRPLHAGIPIWLLTFISIPGSLLIAITDPLAGWWVPPLNLLTILCALALASYLPPILDPRVPPGWQQWIVLAGLYTGVGVVTGIVLALLTGQSQIELVITAISFHLLTGLIASAGRTWWMSTREEQRQFNAESLALRADDLRMLAHARQLRTRAAMILHSQVQTRLLAISSLLAQQDPPIDQAREALRNIRDDVLIPLRNDILSSSVPVATGLDSQSLQRAFPGTTIQMTVRPSASALHEHPRAATVNDLITEAVANAVRHGGASTINIDVVVREDNIGLSVADDGSGIPLDRRIKPGLGLSAIRAASRQWALSLAPSGGTHLQVELD
jgi:two-component sensor histidine kinase